MFNVKSNVDNEVLVFKSKRLMSVVAERLNLGYQLYDKGRVADGRVVYAIADSRTVPKRRLRNLFSLVATPLSAGEVSFAVRFLDG